MRKALPERVSSLQTISDGTDSVNSSEDSMNMDALLKYHHSVQEKIADNMITLARNIKEQSLIANTIIKGDTKVIIGEKKTEKNSEARKEKQVVTEEQKNEKNIEETTDKKVINDNFHDSEFMDWEISTYSSDLLCLRKWAKFVK